MSRLDPKLRKALKALSADLARAGYAPDERAAIVDGATERAEAYMAHTPEPDVEAALALIAEYHSPQFAPEFGGEGQADHALARYAWLALAVAVLGIAGLAPLIGMSGGDGGAVMVLSAVLILPLAGVLSYLSRRSKLGRVAGYATGFVVAAVALVFLSAI